MNNVIKTTIEMPGFDRIRANSTDLVNQRIDWRIRKNVEKHCHSPEAIQRRLEGLDREWDIDRAVMAGSSVVAMAGLLAGITRDRRWLMVPAVQVSLLLCHATSGWCPPLGFFRKMGFRSRQEVDAEKIELRKAGARNYKPF